MVASLYKNLNLTKLNIMKKPTFILLIIFAFIGGEIIAQTYAPFIEDFNGIIYRDAFNTGYDRGGSGGTASNSIFGTQANFSIDLTISGWTPSAAAAIWTGPTHSGMGAIGQGAFTAGMVNRASGANSVVFGLHNVAGPLNSDGSSSWNIDDNNSGGQLAFGYGNQATGNLAFSGGEGTTASGSHSFSFGENSVASGSYSTVIGFETDASDYGSLVIGQYNSSGSSVTSSATSFDTANTAFVIGNGTSATASDAFKVMFNGDTTVSNDLTVSGDVVVSSDARLKANIVSLGSTLARLLLIDGKTYTMKKDGKHKIGVLAQDIQKVFPELVSTDDRDMLAVNYQGLVPVLINALKEQDDKISRLEFLVEKLMSDK
jgi:hypothetical protein